MKKLLAVLFLLTLAYAYLTNGFVNMTSYLNGDYTFYNKNFVNTYLAFNEEISLYTSTPIEAQLTRLKEKNIKAESVRFKGGSEDIDKFIKRSKVEIVKEQTVNNVYIIYGYTERLRGNVSVDGQRINIQIAMREGLITIGTPLILGSY